MGKKKNLQGITEQEMDYINEKMYSSTKKGNSITPINYDFKVVIKCKNKKQKEFLNLLKKVKKEICLGIGSAGTGKSYISWAYALNEIKGPDPKYKKIICLVPTVPAGNMNIGFLKGTLEEKIEPYLVADTDTITKILENSGNYNAKQLAQGLIRNDVIHYDIAQFVRGRTYDNAIILINEAENYSVQEMKLLMTRIGENSKYIITGDEEQCDRSDIKKTKHQMSGMMYAKQKLEELDAFGCVEFGVDDIVRNPLITQILNCWDK